MIWHLNSRVLFEIIKKEFAVWLECYMLVGQNVLAYRAALKLFPRHHLVCPKLITTLVESISCPWEMPEEKNSPGRGVFILCHDMCPGDLFPRKFWLSFARIYRFIFFVSVVKQCNLRLLYPSFFCSRKPGVYCFFIFFWGFISLHKIPAVRQI